ncbi:hypothetical protein CJ216_03985 [Gardnerella greenwoodii]|uniref:Uncharacterized protein n=1 Tax=Gardnerella greenwoodii TaxID=2914925 RepID=A0A2N6RYQ0_9BIFI|nr:hypothetical protein CJ216_03985 [Gardnerella greenwoodii]
MESFCVSGAPNVVDRSRGLGALATELALKAHRAFNLSKLTLRVAFARYTLSAKAGRRAHIWSVRASSLSSKNLHAD